MLCYVRGNQTVLRCRAAVVRGCGRSGSAGTMVRRKRMGFLLHVCCGPCATACVERLCAAGRRPALFYSNDNLCSAAEYDARLAAVRTVAARWQCPLIIDPYDHGRWLDAVAGLDGEPEGGPRCRLCFRHSLARAAGACADRGDDGFATTLTVSPHKRSADVFAAGAEVSSHFEPLDFKKRDGFRRSVVLSRELALYRQRFCGCEFSRR